MTSQISVVEDRNIRPICPNSTVLLSSNSDKQQQSVTIEQLLLQPFEQPKVTAIGHLLSIHLGDTINLEHRSDSPWQCDRLERQDFCLTPHNVSFEARWQDTTESILINLSDRWFQSVVAEMFPQGKIELTIVRGKKDSLIAAVAFSLRNEVARDCSSGRLYYDSLLNTLAVHLAAHYGTRKPLSKPERGLSSDRLKIAIAFMEDNFACNLKLSEIAREVGLSEYYFERQFKKSLGITPHQYLTQFKIKRAQELLKQQDCHLTQISQIAQSCGFSSPSYFAKLFRQTVGVTPKKYRHG